MEQLVKIVGFNLLQRNMSAVANRLKNRRKVNQRATVVVDRWIQKNFQSQGKLAMGGVGWRPLSAQTLALRRKGLGSKKSRILEDTGTLRTRWKHLWTPNLAKVQSGVDYAEQHHYGMFGLPVRRILPLDRQIYPALKELYRKFIKEILQ